jgi:hypothetical protein
MARQQPAVSRLAPSLFRRACSLLGGCPKTVHDGTDSRPAAGFWGNA